jgi:hypothetical protein
MHFPSGRAFPKAANRGKRHPDFLAAFSHEGFFLRFARFDSAARKTIDQGRDDMLGTPDDQHPSFTQGNRHRAAPAWIVGYFFHVDS